MRALFVSDCHVSAEYPDTVACFKRFLNEDARDADELYILGDLFDCWVGDDDDDPANTAVCDALKTLSAQTRIYFQRGNHDFMVGAKFKQRTGCGILPAYCRRTFDGQDALLMHGDLLCTNDVAYQNYRRLVQNPLARHALMRLSLKTRRRIAGQLRRKNRVFNRDKPEDITDVNPDTVVRRMRKYNTRLLIHGHTHRRAEHGIRFADDDTGRRIVLGNWGGNRGNREAGKPVAGNALVLENGKTRWLDFGC